MRIVCTTLGTRGDIQPFAALAKSLGDRGHEVAVATHPWAASLLEFYNVRHIPLMVEEEEGSMYVETGGSLWDFIALIRNGIDGLRKRHKHLLKACEDCDLIIGHYGVIGLVEAEILKKPYVTFAILEGAVPKTERKTFFEILKDLPSYVLEQVASRPFGKYRRELGLPAKSSNANRLTLLGLHNSLVRKDERWVQPTELVGFQFLPTPMEFQPPQHVIDFLQKGEKPLFVTFGSNAQDPEKFNKFFSTLLEALQHVKIRALIQVTGLLADTELPDSVCRVENIPYPWLFAKVSMVIHHGGYGTFGEVLRAGLPSISIPQAADQFARSKEIFDKRLAHEPLDWKKVSREQIVIAIETVLSDDMMHRRLKEVSIEIEEDVESCKAAAVIEKYYHELIPQPL